MEKYELVKVYLILLFYINFNLDSYDGSQMVTLNHNFFVALKGRGQKEKRQYKR